MLQNPRKTLGFKKNMVYKIPPGGGGKPYPASGLNGQTAVIALYVQLYNEQLFTQSHLCEKFIISFILDPLDVGHLTTGQSFESEITTGQFHWILYLCDIRAISRYF